jgi:hypothetical protein
MTTENPQRNQTRIVWVKPELKILPVPSRTENGAFHCKPVEQPMLYKPS